MGSRIDLPVSSVPVGSGSSGCGRGLLSRPIYQFPPYWHYAVGDAMNSCAEVLTDPFNDSEGMTPVVRCALEPTVVFWFKTLETTDTHGFLLTVGVGDAG